MNGHKCTYDCRDCHVAAALRAEVERLKALVETVTQELESAKWETSVILVSNETIIEARRERDDLQARLDGLIKACEGINTLLYYPFNAAYQIWLKAIAAAKGEKS